MYDVYKKVKKGLTHRWQTSRSTRNRVEALLTYAVTGVAAIAAMFPLYWVFTTAFKNPIDAFSMPPLYVPFIQFQPWLGAWQDEIFVKSTEIARYLTNSTVIATGSSLLALALGIPAGYGLARFSFRGKAQDLSFFVLAQRLFPPIAVIIPYYVLYSYLHLLDTHLGMILIYTASNLPLIVWMLREFFLEFPVDMEESAMIDGCSRLGALRKIVIPLNAPGIVAAFMLSFIFSWNEFIFALILTYGNATTMTVEIAGLNNPRGTEFWAMSAACMVTIIPVLLVTIIVQKYIVRGLTFGAVKG